MWSKDSTDLYCCKQACARILRKTAENCYGIVGLSNKKGLTFLSYLFPALYKKNGVEIEIDDDDVCYVNIYVIVEYGTNVKVVAKNLCDSARYNLHKFCDIDCCNINVHVKGIRFSR